MPVRNNIFNRNIKRKLPPKKKHEGNFNRHYIKNLPHKPNKIHAAHYFFSKICHTKQGAKRPYFLRTMLNALFGAPARGGDLTELIKIYPLRSLF